MFLIIAVILPSISNTHLILFRVILQGAGVCPSCHWERSSVCPNKMLIHRGPYYNQPWKNNIVWPVTQSTGTKWHTFQNCMSFLSGITLLVPYQVINEEICYELYQFIPQNIFLAVYLIWEQKYFIYHSHNNPHPTSLTDELQFVCIIEIRKPCIIC